MGSDFQTPLELYQYVRESFSKGTLHPWMRSFPPLEAFNALLSNSKEPFVPILERPLPIALSCQLALLWAALGHAEEASKLASSLEPLIQKGFTSLWTPERDYNEQETSLSFTLLMRALGHSLELPEPTDPFFAWLYHKNLEIRSTELQPLDYKLVNGTTVLCTRNNTVQVGAFRSGSIFIPAFGLHAAPLSNSNLFGIESIAARDGWCCSSASKQAWFKVDAGDDHSLALHSIGVDPEKPVHFVFYVRAQDCKIGDRQFKPKSLLRFSGEAHSVSFLQGKERLEIAADRPLPVELIPLAGDHSFWGASFLLSFRVPSVMGKIHFSLRE